MASPSLERETPAFDELLDRVNLILADAAPTSEDNFVEDFIPRSPRSLREARVSPGLLERIIFRFLLQCSTSAGRQIAAQVALPWRLIEPVLRQYRQDKLLELTGTSAAGDPQFALTAAGRDKARQFQSESTYYGAAPVQLEDYTASVQAQSLCRSRITRDELVHAFEDLALSDAVLNRIGPAVNSGRGMFLYGESGNGKTSVAERMVRAFDSDIWVPKAIAVDGDVIRVFDPAVHTLATAESSEFQLLDADETDRRWVRIQRPTIVAGGELTMEELEVRLNPTSRICEAPLQIKSNCGVLVIDDFGRQRIPVSDLLNRWIVPLEKRIDYLGLPTGKKIGVPFEQLLVFSTNLEPRDLVDAAFLRRIPYKIEIPGPTKEQFRKLLHATAMSLDLQLDEDVAGYLIERHFVTESRPMRFCHPRDLLLQSRSHCEFHQLPMIVTAEAIDIAVENYFAIT